MKTLIKKPIFCKIQKFKPGGQFAVFTPYEQEILQLQSPQLNTSYSNYIDYPPISSPASFNNTTEQIESQSEQPKTKQTSKKQKKPKTSDKKVFAPAEFEQLINEAIKIDPSVKKYRNFLIKTAKRESSFKNIQNTAGAPYYGFFQMGKAEIKSTTGLSVDEFRNNPVMQIIGACRLYEKNMEMIKKLGVYEIGKNKGYSDDALIAGAWMGGPGGVKKYLLGKGDPSDSHWYGGKGGSSVGAIMNNWQD